MQKKKKKKTGIDYLCSKATHMLCIPFTLLLPTFHSLSSSPLFFPTSAPCLHHTYTRACLSHSLLFFCSTSDRLHIHVLLPAPLLSLSPLVSLSLILSLSFTSMPCIRSCASLLLIACSCSSSSSKGNLLPLPSSSCAHGISIHVAWACLSFSLRA